MKNWEKELKERFPISGTPQIINLIQKLLEEERKETWKIAYEQYMFDNEMNKERMRWYDNLVRDDVYGKFSNLKDYVENLDNKVKSQCADELEATLNTVISPFWDRFHGYFDDVMKNVRNKLNPVIKKWRGINEK